MDAAAALAAVPFLQELEPPELQALAEICHRQEYITGDDILKQGELTRRFFVIEQGHVNLRKTDVNNFERPIGSKGPGEFFGIKMFTTEEPSEYTFEAVGAAVMWVIEREGWDLMLETYPDVLEHMPALRAEYNKLTRGLDWLSPGEIITLVTRRHWWALLLMMRLPALIAVVFTLAFALSIALGVTTRLPYVLPAYGTALLVAGLWSGWEVLNWWNDTYIITNKRVVRINRVLFISDSRSEIAIDKIQSQRVERGGPISVLLNISDLRITSASSDTAGVVFEQVGDVRRLQRAIDAQKIRVTEQIRAQEREELRNSIARDVRSYVFRQRDGDERPISAPPGRASSGRRLSRFWPPRRRLIPFLKPGLGWRGLWGTLLGTQLRDGQKVTWRKHYVVLLEQIWPALLGLLIVVLLTAFFVISGVPLGLAANGVYAVLFVLFFFALGYLVWQWEDWRVDLYRLTDSEIIDIVSLPLGLRYDEKRAALRNIQDVNTARPAIWNTLLDYGNVEVRVAGNAAPFTFDSVAHPRVVADEIQQRIETLKILTAKQATRERTQSIVDGIVAYHRLSVEERFRNEPSFPIPTGPTPVALPAEAPASPAPPAPVAPPLPPDDREFPSEADIRPSPAD